MCDYPNREAAMVTLRRDAEGVPTVWCDPCIVPLVAALNAGGLQTVASCCGHGRRPSVVALADGREVIVARSYEEARRLDELFPDINFQGNVTGAGYISLSDHGARVANDREPVSERRDGDGFGRTYEREGEL